MLPFFSHDEQLLIEGALEGLTHRAYGRARKFGVWVEHGYLWDLAEIKDPAVFHQALLEFVRHGDKLSSIDIYEDKKERTYYATATCGKRIYPITANFTAGNMRLYKLIQRGLQPWWRQVRYTQWFWLLLSAAIYVAIIYSLSYNLARYGFDDFDLVVAVAAAGTGCTLFCQSYRLLQYRETIAERVAAFERLRPRKEPNFSAQAPTPRKPELPKWFTPNQRTASI